MDRSGIVSALSNQDAVSILKKFLNKCRENDLAYHAYVAHRFYAKYNRKTIEFVLSNTRPEVLHLLDSNNQIWSYDKHFYFSNLFVAGKRLFEFEFVIDHFLVYPKAAHINMKALLQFLLVYVCNTPAVYSRERLQTFVSLCLENEVSAEFIRDTFFSTLVGGPIIL
jgi:hypothetical protein